MRPAKFPYLEHDGLLAFAHRGGDDATRALLAAINADGRVYLTPTRHAGRQVIRVQVGQFDCREDDVMTVAEVVAGLAGRVAP